jgi:uncharacterized protein (DUF952 family)
VRDRYAYHLVAADWFQAQPVDRAYLPEAFAREGFIHLTHGLDAVLAVGNRYYRADPRPYLLLTVDLAAVTAPVRYADSDLHQSFPHLHGPLERAALVAVQGVERGADGTFERLHGVAASLES